MSVRVMADVWDVGPEDATDCSVLVALANHCDDDGRSCFPSVERIAKMLRRSQKTVERAIQALEAGEWIWVERGGGRGVYSSYTINVGKLKERQSVAFYAKSAEDKRRHLRPDKATLCPQKATSTVPYKEEPSKNHQENKNTPPPPSGDGGVELPAISREELLQDLAEANELRARMTPPKPPFTEAEWAKLVADSHRAAAAKAQREHEAAQWEPRRTRAGRLRWRRRGG